MADVVKVATDLASQGAILFSSVKTWKGTFPKTGKDPLGKIGSLSSLPPIIRDAVSELSKKTNDNILKYSFFTEAGRFIPVGAYPSWLVKQKELEEHFEKIQMGIFKSRGAIVEAAKSSAKDQAKEVWDSLYPEDGTEPPASFVLNLGRRLAENVPTKLALLDMFSSDTLFYAHPLCSVSNFPIEMRDRAEETRENSAWEFLESVPVAYAQSALKCCDEILGVLRNGKNISSRSRGREVSSIKILLEKDIMRTKDVQESLGAALGELDRRADSDVDYDLVESCIERTVKALEGMITPGLVISLWESEHEKS
jgi:hypothetical protein